MTQGNTGEGRFVGEAVHFHVSGSIGAALLPWWLNWFRVHNPDVLSHVTVSPSAARFVSIAALEALVNGRVWADSWDSVDRDHYWRMGGPSGRAAIIVIPASLDTLMRLSQGRADSPALMMMQLATMPIVLADSVPGRNEVIDHWTDVLKLRPNIRLAPRVHGYRAVDRTVQESGFNFPGAIETASNMLADTRTS